MSQFVNGKYVNGVDDKHRILVDPSKPGTFAIAPVATVTTTANGTTVVAQENDFDLGALFGAVVTVVVTAAPTGTTPTLVVNLQDATTVGGSYTTRGSSTSINAAGTYYFFAPITDLFYRATWTVGGTTPSFNFAVFVTPFAYGVDI